MSRISMLAAAAGAVVAQGALGQATHLNDDFDCYQPGDAISTLAAWELWPGGEEAYISDEQAFSGANSLRLDRVGADVVHQLGRFGGADAVTYSMMTYVSSAASDTEAYIIALSQYDGGGVGTVWDVQVKFDAPAGLLDAEFTGHTTPLITDRWVQLRAEIDFSRSEYDVYYDGVLFAPDIFWGTGTHTAVPDVAAIDLYLHAGSGMYVDDVVVAEAGTLPPPTCGGVCYGDCDGSGEVDFFDFLCFQNLFAAGDPRADCDQDGDLTFFDFLCFQNAFAAGCP